MGKKSGDYFGLGKIISLLLTLIGLGWILGVVTRFLDGKPVAGILRIFIGLPFSLIDIIMILLTGKMMRLINI